MRIESALAVGLLACQLSSALVGDERPMLREQWARRDAWQLPDKVIEALALEPGATVADLGAGKGYFSHRIARAVAPDGRVIALDINANSLEVNRSLALEAGITNIETRVVTKDEPGLLHGETDVVLISKTWHWLPARRRYVARLRESLRASDRVAVIGTGKESVPRASRPFRTDRYEVQREAEAAGFTLDVAYDFLPKQFFVVLRPGRASVFAEIPEFRYITAELAIGTGPPDSLGLARLTERGFLTVVDMRSGGEDFEQLKSEVEHSRMQYVHCSSADAQYFKALATHLNDRDTGIAFVFANSAIDVGIEITHLVASGDYELTEFELHLLKEWLEQ